jgi:hypothetical protein
VPGSQKSNFPHPNPDAHKPGLSRGKMDDLEATVEVHLQAGDALLFVDAIPRLVACLCPGSTKFGALSVWRLQRLSRATR